ncbi:MAG TPA: tetratricopeptide repeat protein [Candidatus Limnocylindrales bacterium]|nr:tetratricopeptide repeat protein [Candidatus Limnocylindrales bacterium]
MSLPIIKARLEVLKAEDKLHYEWVKSYRGSLILKNLKEDKEELEGFLIRDAGKEIVDKISFNPFSPAEFNHDKFLIIHKEKIEKTEAYKKFEEKFRTEISDIEFKRAMQWIAQFPFFEWKLYALKLLTNIIFLNEEKVNQKLKELSNPLSVLKNCVISDIEGVAKSSEHLFYPLNKLTEISKKNFIHSESLTATDGRDIVFIDDLIGTGNQARNYIDKLKKEGKIGNQKLYYFAIVGLRDGIKELKNSGIFEKVLTTVEIQNKAFDTGYIFTTEESGEAKEMASELGKQLTKGLKEVDPLGYKNSEALVFFGHNNPNNSLPIFWASGKCKLLEKVGESTEIKWTPLFPRKVKPKSDSKITVKNESSGVNSKTNIPYLENKFFTGRIEKIEELHNALKSNKTAAISQPQAISGLGGIGKTQTAVKYAYQYWDEYKYILWANADSLETLIPDFVAIAKMLNLPNKDAKEQNLVINSVKLWLETVGEWLLIFDNADKPELIENFFPSKPKGHILVTSRAQTFPNLDTITSVELDKLEPEESVQFLLKRTGRTDVERAEYDAIEQLAKEFDYLPLAMEQAGAYISQRRSSFQDYLSSYHTRGLELLEKFPPVTDRDTNIDKNRKTVAKTWSLNFEEVEKASPAAADLLYASAFLSHDNIPFEIISNGSIELGEALSSSLKNIKTDPLIIEDILDPLTKFSLIHRNPGKSLYSIHRMVQVVLRDRMDEKDQRMWSERVLKAVNRAFPEVEFPNWNTCDILLPHAKACSELIDNYRFETPEAANLLNGAGCYLRVRVRFEEAHPFFMRALEIREKIFKPESQEIAKSLNSLAGLYLEMGKYAESEPLYKRAQAIKERILEPDHPDVAKSLNNLAQLYRIQGKYDASEPLYKRALAIRGRILKPDHPDVAASLNNLAQLYQDMGKYDASEPLYKRALEIREKVLVSTHPDIAASLNNLATLYQDQGKYDASEPLYKQALEISEKALGSAHPNVATSLNNLALLYKAQGKYDASEPLCKRALEISEKALGSAHPDVGTRLNNLATLYQAQGKYAKAAPLYHRAIEIAEKSLGEEHPDFLTYLINYKNFLSQIRTKPRELAKIQKRINSIENKRQKEKHK